MSTRAFSILVSIIFAIGGTLCVGVQVYGCTGTGKGAIMTGAFEACAEADLGRAVGSTNLLGAVAAIVNENTTGLESDLTALAVRVGIASVQCAIVAVEAVLASTASAPGSGGSTTPTPTPTPSTAFHPPSGLTRALAWSASATAPARAKP